MRIGELAQVSGTPIETIRFYEREGLLPAAARTEGNYRIYTPQHADRLGFIRQCRSLDMTLDEVRVLLRFKDQPLADCGEVNQVLDDHIGHVAKRIQELRELETELRELRSRCQSTRPGQACAILQELNHPQAGETAPRPTSDIHTHVGAVHRRKAGVNT